MRCRLPPREVCSPNPACVGKKSSSLIRSFSLVLRGPEVETWIGVKEGEDPAAENDWSAILPFLALADGAHS
jgi:hypothetical protein